MPDRTLRLFAPGTGGINTFTAPAGGRSWSLQSGSFWGGAIAEAAGVIGATLTKDGQPVTAWRGNAAEGVPPASIPQAGYQGGMTESFLATDAASGAVVLSGETNAGQGGVYVQQILPSQGPHVVLPPLAKDWSDGSAAGSARRASTSRTPTARPCGSTATAAARRRSPPARTAARPSAPAPKGGSGSPGAT